MKSALAHLLLIFAAVLFLVAVITQRLPLQGEPAFAAQHIVTWYAHRIWTLWILLLALPLSVLISGCISLWDSSGSIQVTSLPEKAVAILHLAGSKRFVAATTVTAGIIVGIVILHMAAN
jgi:hypothetical protein